MPRSQIVRHQQPSSDTSAAADNFSSLKSNPLSADTAGTDLSSTSFGFPSAAHFGASSGSATALDPLTTITSAMSDVQTKYGQITPPDDNWKVDWDMQPEQEQPVFSNTTAPNRRDSEESSASSSSSKPGHSSGKVDKRDKYREKNRVAAAKCRAKKKEHVDGLEENHRTQSMLNSLLKQTEQNLRDELSFWRTQALQHAFCDCQAIQDYNLRKARALAADKDFGGTDMMRRDSIANSPNSKTSNNNTFYQMTDDFQPQQA